MLNMENNIFDVDWSIDKELNATLTLTCKSCGNVQKLEFETLKPGYEFACLCGISSVIDNAGFVSAQNSLTELRRALHKLGK